MSLNKISRGSARYSMDDRTLTGLEICWGCFFSPSINVRVYITPRPPPWSDWTCDHAIRVIGREYASARYIKHQECDSRHSPAEECFLLVVYSLTVAVLTWDNTAIDCNGNWLQLAKLRSPTSCNAFNSMSSDLRQRRCRLLWTTFSRTPAGGGEDWKTTKLPTCPPSIVRGSVGFEECDHWWRGFLDCVSKVDWPPRALVMLPGLSVIWIYFYYHYWWLLIDQKLVMGISLIYSTLWTYQKPGFCSLYFDFWRLEAIN